MNIRGNTEEQQHFNKLWFQPGISAINGGTVFLETMEERYKRFTNFDFVNNMQWQGYLKGLYFNPTLPQVVKLKRKWYKQHVDPDLDVNYEPPVSQPQPQPRSQQSSPQIRPPLSNTGTPNALGLLECLLFALVLPGLYFDKGLHFAIAGFLSGLLSNHGLPKLNTEYWRGAVFSDDLHSIVFCIIFLMYPNASLWLLPVLIGAVSRISEIANRYPRTPAVVKPLVHSLHLQKYDLDNAKSQVEIGMGVAILILALLGAGNLVFTLIYWNFLRMKFMVNTHTSASFSALRIIIDPYVRKAPRMVQVVWDKFLGICEAVTAPQQSSSCSVM